MSEIRERIKQDLVTAMKSGEKEKVSTLRYISSQFKDFEVKNRAEPTDADVMGILRKAIKSRNDSIEEFKKGDREDLVAKEESEISIISHYVPPAPDEAQVEKVIDEVIAESGASSMKDMGAVMKASLAKFDGSVDGGVVSGLVKKRLNELQNS
ncbi:MAG: GatB/YqeY domain-containing protein [Candidatus Lindowbacteria bacterium]|nr:GatB/YqeY domain-containing protein [Candidatus Lindowbacteria bacterium]